MDICDIFDDLESLHQDLKYKYLEWASNKKDRGIGSAHNPLTKDFIENVMDDKTKNKIEQNLKLLSNYQCDKRAKYNLIRELYMIHPSFHEIWFFSHHYPHGEILKHRNGLKSYLKTDNTIKKKICTTFLLKMAILLENLYSSQLKKTLLDYDSVDNVEDNIRFFLSKYNENLSHEEVLKMLPGFFRIVKTLLETTNYFSFDNIMKYNIWFDYAYCSINEGPIFIKKSKKPRIEIIKELKNLNENEIRKHLNKNFIVEEVANDDKVAEFYLNSKK